ncbi:unnamed protein product [Pocillopora meandrina]|uniref:SWIM-type domain-containing protein n=1 Tax=Pocillopora meandrina TaxID=46732 RepID=A0AAU9WAT6_9CNID|nr:unnamed protein product [Pocillopora meandrina]
MDLLSFVVLDTSYYGKDQFKAYRSLQSSNQLVSGFVNSVKGQKNRINDPFVALWIITGHNGTVLFAHCVGCMAVQGECCSHIASVLFYIEAWNRIDSKLTCTQVKSTWLLQTAVKEVPNAPVADIDFRSAKKLK